MPVWGYNLTGSAATQAGGPTLIFNEGDTVQIRLHNQLGEATALLFQGQQMIPDLTGVAPGGTRLYSFIADQPGTYLYEAGLLPNAQHQVAMGLYGALIVRPAATGPLPPQTTPLTVVNPGFEDNVLGDGAYTTSFVAGWTTTGGGEFNPTTAHFSSQAPEGANTAYNNGGTISQLLGDTLTAGSIYTLTVQVGDRLDTAFPGYTVGLWAGVVELASTDQTGYPGVNDGWVTAEVTYEALAADPQLGLPLEIRLSSAGAQTNFDDVQLTATAPAKTAYGDAATAYDDEAVLLLSEIDPALNNSANPAAFDMRNYKPHYFLINGKVYPNTDPIPTAAGNNVLLRYVNAGIQYHSMALLGAHQMVIALDGSQLDFSRRFVAETFGPGQTADAIVAVPAATVDGSKFAVYDGNLMLHNSSAGGFGGMMTFLDISNGPVADAGPVTSNVAYLAGTLTALVDDSATGGSTIQAAEYYLDSTAGTGTAMYADDLAFDEVSEVVTATVTVPAGPHTLYVRGQDANLNWGAFSSVLVDGGDETGPITEFPALVPNPSNGTVGVALHATGNDTTTGGSNIDAAEYFTDTVAPGDGTPMEVNGIAPIASLDAVINAADVLALTDGPHVVSVRSHDSAGNWGQPVTITLVVDTAGPLTSNVTADPSPNNGTLRFNPSTPAVRVMANLSDTTTGGSNIVAAEGFIDSVGTNGTGIVFVASDGLYNSPSEAGYVDIPLTTVIQLSNGSHTIYVHARDAAGNWGLTSSTILVVDKTAPEVSQVTADPNPTGDAITVTLSANVTDTATAVTMAEWFTGADPGLGNATAMTIGGSGPWNLSATIDVSAWLNGDYTLFVRARDAAGNWSALQSTVLTVDKTVLPVPLLFFSTDANTNIYGWYGGMDYGTLFDGTAAGLPAGTIIDAIHVVIGPGNVYSMYMSFTGGFNLTGVGNVDDSDIVLYNASGWSLYFDGSDVGLTTDGEDVDAFDILAGGDLIISTIGNGNVPLVGGFNDEDLLQFTPTSTGANTSGSWTWYFDGSDVSLTAGGEDVDGASVSAGNIYLSTLGNFNTGGGFTGQGVDVFACNAPTTGPATACGSFSMFFDGDVNGITDNLMAIDIP